MVQDFDIDMACILANAFQQRLNRLLAALQLLAKAHAVKD
jgi:hypothetical protein